MLHFVGNTGEERLFYCSLSKFTGSLCKQILPSFLIKSTSLLSYLTSVSLYFLHLTLHYLVSYPISMVCLRYSLLSPFLNLNFPINCHYVSEFCAWSFQWLFNINMDFLGKIISVFPIISTYFVLSKESGQACLLLLLLLVFILEVLLISLLSIRNSMYVEWLKQIEIEVLD